MADLSSSTYKLLKDSRPLMVTLNQNDSNQLEDGDGNPVFNDTDSWNPSVDRIMDANYNLREGDYFKIGSIVLATYNVIVASTTGAAGNALSLALPISTTGSSGTFVGGTISVLDNYNGLAGPEGVYLEIAGSLRFDFKTIDGALTEDNVLDNFRVAGTAIYRV